MSPIRPDLGLIAPKCPDLILALLSYSLQPQRYLYSFPPQVSSWPWIPGLFTKPLHVFTEVISRETEAGCRPSPAVLWAITTP